MQMAHNRRLLDGSMDLQLRASVFRLCYGLAPTDQQTDMGQTTKKFVSMNSTWKL